VLEGYGLRALHEAKEKEGKTEAEAKAEGEEKA